LTPILFNSKQNQQRPRKLLLRMPSCCESSSLRGGRCLGV
jgi:hypothetical protein